MSSSLREPAAGDPELHDCVALTEDRVLHLVPAGDFQVGQPRAVGLRRVVELPRPVDMADRRAGVDAADILGHDSVHALRVGLCGFPDRPSRYRR